MATRRTWQVLVFGGASGVGKTSVSYRLAHAFRVGPHLATTSWLLLTFGALEWKAG